MAEFFASLTIMEGIFLFCGSIGSLFFILRLISMIMGFSSGQTDAIDANDASGSLLQDLDGNGIPDALESDALGDMSMLQDLDGDGIPDAVESASNLDGADFDGDGVADSIETDPGENKISEIIATDNVPIKKGPKLIELSLQNISAFLMVFGLIGLGLTKFSGIPSIVSSIVGFICGTFTAFIFTKATQAMMKLSSSGNKVITSTIGQIGTVYLRIPVEGTGQIQINVSGRLEICDAESVDKVEIPYGEEVQVVRVKKGNILCVTKNVRKLNI